MGSRYGGIKQLDQFGPNGETIIDYSLFDAIRAGFGKVVFIIREELRDDFEAVFRPKLAGRIEYEYAIQSLDACVPADLGPVTRTKPWGTGHAMLCARQQTQTPFAVINADDFYGLEAFQIIADFLTTDTDDAQHALVGYQVKNTLSEFGSVSRGVCVPDETGNLISVTERTKIFRQNGGKIVFEEGDTITALADDTPVSMNFWGFKPAVFPLIQQQFEQYARANFDAPKAEFYIPTVMSNLIRANQGRCRVFTNESEWFGVTYPADKPTVQASLKRLHDAGAYPATLWE